MDNEQTVYGNDRSVVTEKSGASSEKDSSVTLEDHMAQGKEIISNANSKDEPQPEVDAISGAAPKVAVVNPGGVDAMSGAAPKGFDNWEIQDTVVDSITGARAVILKPGSGEFNKKVENIKKNGDNNTDAISSVESRLLKESNQDVVLALMIAEEKLAMAQAFGEMSADNPHYIVHGARLVCSCGTREARLIVPLDHGVYANSHPQLTIKDSKSLVNIKCFGNCTSMNNPSMEEAAKDAVKEFNKVNPKSLFKKEEINPSKEMLNLSICECIPSFQQAGKWSEGNDKHWINGEKTLTQQAKMVCDWGGIIRIYTDGQDE